MRHGLHAEDAQAPGNPELALRGGTSERQAGQVIFRRRAEPFGEYVGFLSAVTEQPTLRARMRAPRLQQRPLPRYCNNAVKSAALMRRASRPCQSRHKRAMKQTY